MTPTPHTQSGDDLSPDRRTVHESGIFGCNRSLVRGEIIRDRRRPYVSVRARFGVSVAAGLGWAAFATWLTRGWLSELAGLFTWPAAVTLFAGLVVVPSYLNSQLLATLLVDRPRPLPSPKRLPALSLVMAVRSWEDGVAETIDYAMRSAYPGRLSFVVVAHGTDGRTARRLQELSGADERLTVLDVPAVERAEALNRALESISAPLVATIVPGTLLMPSSLQLAVARLICSPPDTVAVAGCVLVRNSRDGLLARIQEWDYFIGMASARRQQAFLQGTLVLPTAFSIHDAEALRQAGGWPNRVGQDVVPTLAMIREGGRTTFEPTAVAFTKAPTQLDGFIDQRIRWARGLVEGLRRHGVALLRRWQLFTHAVASSFLFPFLDAVYTLAFVPGIVLAAHGNLALVGPVIVAVLPMTSLVALVGFLHQRRSFRWLGLRVRWNVLGFLIYVVAYPLLTAPISLAGYVGEVLGSRRRPAAVQATDGPPFGAASR